ncbi:hypothetical protein [Candidatus Tisiphia endosymbiont of Beris chalybata]|uniref:hypothetical protein n=1 Tax=Candidatus Tisiphia endosymbiont of Beris chalybata TaxID=3066262 RepID=UPI00312C7210
MTDPQSKSDKISILKKVTIGILILLTIITLTNIMIRHYIWREYYYQNSLKLEEHHYLVKSLIIDKLNINHILNDQLVSDKISLLKKHIKNHVFVSKDHLPDSDGLPYITIQELLEILLGQTFKYVITINNQHVISNGLINSNNSLIKKYPITNDLSYIILIKIDPNSNYEQQAIVRINHQILLINRGSVFIFLVFSIIIFYLLNRDRKIKIHTEQLQFNLTNSILLSENISLFHKINEEFILKCYQYFKNCAHKNLLDTTNIEEHGYNNEYFPLPIMTSATMDNVSDHEIVLDSIILDLKNYFKGYTAYYGSNITLDITSTIDKITVPFEYEVFNQIIISLLSNILYFNKNTDKQRCIKLVFQNNLIICSSEGFSLDQNLAIRYSEKIFNDTANLYILNLGQIFILLKNSQINYSVIRNGHSTAIEIKLDNMKLESNSKSAQTAKVIKLNKYRKDIK